MNKKILKINSWILITIGSILMAAATICMIFIISIPSEPNSWDTLGKGVVVIGGGGIYLLASPLMVTGICTLKYLKGKNTYKLIMIFNKIGIILYAFFTFVYVYMDTLSIFKDYVNGDVNTELKIIWYMVIFFLFLCPLIVNAIGLYKEKNNLKYKDIWHRCRFVVIGISAIILVIVLYNLYRINIINTNKIEITEDNTYSYSDFKSQLESRNLIYKLPANLSELAGQHEITALDSGNKVGYQFSSGSYTDSYRLSVNTDRKFPLLVYDSYTSLIKKSDETADYYYIGPEDWYITWYIYYVNGKIYAAIGDESEYGKGWYTSLAKTRYGVVVSEEDDITIYNAKNNYFVKGGGILDTRSGDLRIGFPTTTDIYNRKCMKIRVVDKVDAETLDKIAKELSPQYWKTYKKFNF